MLKDDLIDVLRSGKIRRKGELDLQSGEYVYRIETAKIVVVFKFQSYVRATETNLGIKLITCWRKKVTRVVFMTAKLTKLTQAYHYTESGLKNIWLEGIYLDQDGDPVIPNLLQLHEVIAKGLALQKKRLSGNEIRFLRTHIGLSSGDFAKKIVKVSPETVSRWENNKQTMDVSIELLLRMLVLKKIRFDDYEFEDLADLKNDKQRRLAAKFSVRSKKWELAA